MVGAQRRQLARDWARGGASIIIFFDRTQYGTIAYISVPSYLSFAYGFLHLTARLFEVQTIIELALADEGPHFGEITGELLPRDIDQTELAHTGGIDDLAGVWGGLARCG